jgi:Primase C terminal 2 (PriCT-2)
MSELFSQDEVRKALATMLEPGAVFEIRAVGAQLRGSRRTSIVSGYFNNADACLSELEKLVRAKGIYFTLNPVDPALLARRHNRLDYGENNDTTKDHHILRRRWLLIDVDPDRASGISATSQEKEAAHKKAREIHDYLQGRGWHLPVVADSGNGYYLLYRVDLPCMDDRLFEQVLTALAKRFDGDGVTLDRSVSNPSRIAKLHGTLAAKGDNILERPWRMSKILRSPLQVKVTKEQLQELVDELLPKEPEKPKAVVSRSAERNSKLSKAEVREMLAVIPKQRPHYDDWIKVVSAVGDALSDADAIEVLNEWSAEESPGEYADKLQHRLTEVHIGTLIHLAKQHGWTPAPKVTLTSEPREEAGDDITSLTSFDLTPYPAPLGPAAFHGLAGDFVNRILPCTEADPAALLFTFLVAFGNVIGRTAHAIADGARHYCNLNAVLVGKTGKGRKGAAQWHTDRLFSCVEQGWVENCIASGLSTGEGLISAVQDAVTKTVKNKNGDEVTKIVEPAAKDKRLLVVQTEFSTALKAMEREGNTLSSVIRDAWDCKPKLRTMTKNSPTRATNPHISIIAHITGEELGPGLSEIEASNGFANRFLWPPVKRSKELPEGGELPDITDLIEPLQNAVDFARNLTEPLKRDEDARKLWASIYHDLSAEKPGLFGKITARSEAQTLRLSDIYALLDCSKLVRVEHLEAALEAWRYCEDGARWSFRTGTGNRNADRILAALAATEKKGMSRWQITNDVFNRNTPKHVIDEALRLLYRLKLAVREFKGTATKPAEWWFFNLQSYEEYEQSTPEDTPKGNTSYSSYPPASKKASSAESDTEAETLVGDSPGVLEL